MELTPQEARILWQQFDTAHILAVGLIQSFVKFAEAQGLSDTQQKLANTILNDLAPLQPALNRYCEMKAKIKEGFTGIGIENIEIKGEA